MKTRSWMVFIVWLLVSWRNAHGESDPLANARKYLDKGQTKAAVIELKNHLQEHPDDVAARLLIGEVYLKMGDAPAAAKAYERARDLHASKEQWLLPLGQAYLQQNDAAAVLREIKPDPDAPPALQARILGTIGTAYARIGDLVKAQEHFDAALKLDAHASEALLGLALLAMGRSDYPQAIRLAEKVVAQNPENLMAYALLGEAQRITGDYRGALQTYDKALAVRPGHLESLLGRAHIHLVRGRLEDAAKDLEQARKTAGDIPLTLYLEGMMAYERGKFEEAFETAQKVTNLIPEYFPARLLLGTAAYQVGKLEIADRELTLFNRAYPDQLLGAKILAATRLKQGRPAEAIPVLKAVEPNHGNDVQLLGLLGTASLQAGQVQEGNAYLARAAALDPKSAAIKAQMGLGQMAAGNIEAAIGDLKAAAQLDDKLYQADTMLVLALLQAKNYDQAIEAAAKVAAKMKDDPMGENLLGAAYMAKGDTQAAQEHWNAALRIKPGYAAAAANLARLEMSRNRPEEAIRHFREVLKADPDNVVALVGLAGIAEAQRDYGKMEEYLLRAREKNPQAIEPGLLLTRYYVLQNQPLKAIEIARDTYEKNPENPAVLESLAKTQLANRQLADAIATTKKLIGLAPAVPDHQLLYAKLLRQNGESQAALGQLDKIVKAFPDFIPAQVASAEVAAAEGKFDQAMKTAKSLQSKHPKSAAGYRLEGELLLAQRQAKASLPALEKAQQLEPDSVSIRRLSTAWHLAGDQQRSVEVLKSWLKEHDADADAWMALAGVQQAIGNTIEAIAAYEKRESLGPGNLIVLNNLAWLYQTVGDRRALPLAEQLLARGGDKPEITDTVGWILVQNGQLEKGLGLLQETVQRAPAQPAFRLHLAEALIKAGKKGEAKLELQRLADDKREFPDRKRAEELLRGL